MTLSKTAIAIGFLLSACETLPTDVQPLRGVAPVSTSTRPAPLLRSFGISAINSSRAIAPSPARRPAAELAFMKAQLNAMQPRSIAENREYCGYLGLNAAGQYVITPPKRGTTASCAPVAPANMRVLASYHTHAAYAARYDNEAPSVQDVEGDFRNGINGYLATPGGRIWQMDAATQSIEMVCGLGCVASDPNFRVNRQNPVPNSFTLAELRRRNH